MQRFFGGSRGGAQAGRWSLEIQKLAFWSVFEGRVEIEVWFFEGMAALDRSMMKSGSKMAPILVGFCDFRGALESPGGCHPKDSLICVPSERPARGS